MKVQEAVPMGRQLEPTNKNQPKKTNLNGIAKTTYIAYKGYKTLPF